MSRSDEFEAGQMDIRHFPAGTPAPFKEPKGTMPDMEHRSYAMVRGRPVGRIQWLAKDAPSTMWDGGGVLEPTPNAVTEVYVTPARRRQGIATALWNHAQSLPDPPRHSNERSLAGDAWAKKMGGHLPENLNERWGIHGFRRKQ